MIVRGVRIRFHPLFIGVLAVAAYGGFLVDTVVWFAIVILHELGHVAAAKVYGYKTAAIELLPFGGVTTLSSSSLGWNPRHETAIALCGPFVNLLLALLGAILHLTRILGDQAAAAFMTINLTLLAFNLLPALPLDGGRIARAGLAKDMGFADATRVVTTMSFLFAIALMILGTASLAFGYADAGLLALGAFLLFSAYTLSKQAKYDTLRFLDAKRHEQGVQLQPLRTIAVMPDTPVGQVAASFVPGAYHLVYVTDHPEPRTRADQTDRLTALRTVEEGRILEAIFESRMWAEPISALLS